LFILIWVPLGILLFHCYSQVKANLVQLHAEILMHFVTYATYSINSWLKTALDILCFHGSLWFMSLQLVESLAEITENGTRDQHSDALVRTSPHLCLRSHTPHI